MDVPPYSISSDPFSPGKIIVQVYETRYEIEGDRLSPRSIAVWHQTRFRPRPYKKPWRVKERDF